MNSGRSSKKQRANDIQRTLHITKSGTINQKFTDKRTQMWFLQFLRVDFDDQGKLHQLTNLQNNVSTTFSNQGLYWYHSE